jgi:hypothetical protein
MIVRPIRSWRQAWELRAGIRTAREVVFHGWPKPERHLLTRRSWAAFSAELDRLNRRGLRELFHRAGFDRQLALVEPSFEQREAYRDAFLLLVKAGVGPEAIEFFAWRSIQPARVTAGAPKVGADWSPLDEDLEFEVARFAAAGYVMFESDLREGFEMVREAGLSGQDGFLALRAFIERWRPRAFTSWSGVAFALHSVTRGMTRYDAGIHLGNLFGLRSALRVALILMEKYPTDEAASS